MTDQYFLSKGAHSTAADGRCAMEWVSYLAGEAHSDQPVCVSPVLKSFCIRLNDRLPDAERQNLRPYLARTIGTAGDGRDPERRRLCTEWLLHTALPLRFEQLNRSEVAERLRGLPSDLAVENVRRVLREVRDEAYVERDSAVTRLQERVRVELEKRAGAAAAAVADAAADAAADAVAVAVADADAAADAAAVAVADAAADAAAVAVAVAVADAAAVAVADAVADAAAAAAAVADADAAAVAVAVAVAAADSSKYWAIRDRVYKAVYDRIYARREVYAQRVNAELIPAAFALLDRMLPTEVIQIPVAADAEQVCRIPVGA